jgi:Uma2 family endonuclease
MRSGAFRLTEPRDIDQRVYLRGVDWSAYEALLAWRGESARPRLTYLEGVIELMSPSTDHEGHKTKLARLFEAWAEEVDVRVEGVGSWTIKDPSVERGAEPDECYLVGVPTIRGAKRPDIAIEVVWTSGGIDKLEVYRKLAVPEVCVWENAQLAFHLLRGERYVRATRSEILPTFDVALVTRCMTIESQVDAVKALRKELRARPAPKKRRKK